MRRRMNRKERPKPTTVEKMIKAGTILALTAGTVAGGHYIYENYIKDDPPELPDPRNEPDPPRETRPEPMPGTFLTTEELDKRKWSDDEEEDEEQHYGAWDAATGAFRWIGTGLVTGLGAGVNLAGKALKGKRKEPPVVVEQQNDDNRRTTNAEVVQGKFSTVILTSDEAKSDEKKYGKTWKQHFEDLCKLTDEHQTTFEEIDYFHKDTKFKWIVALYDNVPVAIAVIHRKTDKNYKRLKELSITASDSQGTFDKKVEDAEKLPSASVPYNITVLAVCIKPGPGEIQNAATEYLARQIVLSEGKDSIFKVEVPIKHGLLTKFWLAENGHFFRKLNLKPYLYQTKNGKQVHLISQHVRPELFRHYYHNYNHGLMRRRF